MNNMSALFSFGHSGESRNLTQLQFHVREDITDPSPDEVPAFAGMTNKERT
jgi:hypothetical protein